MKKYTQEEFDSFTRNECGWKICPTGDYSDVDNIDDRCIFGAGSILPELNSFGWWRRFAERYRNWFRESGQLEKITREVPGGGNLLEGGEQDSRMEEEHGKED